MKVYIGFEHYNNGEWFEDRYECDELLFVSDSLDTLKEKIDEYIEHEQREETLDTDEGELYSFKELDINGKHIPFFIGTGNSSNKPNKYRAFKCTDDDDASYVYYYLECELV